ncbi:spindle assembly checkpoint component Mad1 [Lipomyces oligophaga]|uniref:spindle assembly checkpoint component Mad1 n=1 Tax=Lipomyces oligophaga TaxID=45792 RepID=UPI0034CD90C3
MKKLSAVPNSANGSSSAIPVPQRRSSLAGPPPGSSTRPVSRTLFTDTKTAQKADATADSLKAENHALKYELSTLKHERDREKLRTEKVIRDLEARIAEEGKRTESAESDQAFVVQKLKETSEELTKLKENYPSIQTSFERSIRSLRQEADQAREAQEAAEQELRSIQSSTKRRLDDSTLKQMTLQSSVAELELQLLSATDTIKAKSLVINELTDQVEMLTSENNEIKSKKEELDNLQDLQIQLGEEIAMSRSLEAKLHILTPELNELREEQSKYKFLAEEKLLLEGRLKLMEDLRRKLADAELEAASLREQQSKWTAFLESNDSFNTPEDVFYALSQERVKNFALLDKIGRIEAELSARNVDIADDSQELSKARKEIGELNESISKTAKYVARIERQKNLALKEAGFLREQLKTYDSEETLLMQNNFDKQKTTRIEQLELLLDETKEEFFRVSDELKELSKGLGAKSQKRSAEPESDERLGELIRRNRQLQDEITQLITEKETIQHTTANLQKQVEALESSNAAHLRIVQLRDNPFSRDQIVKKDMLDTLRLENQSLLAQLDGRREDVGQVVSVNTLDRLRLEIKEMQKEVAEKEKRMTRLKQIWGTKSVEFREMVYSLLGYKLDFLPNNKIRATSIFATSDDESFTFDPTNMTMKLSGKSDSPFAQECSNLITFWVHERREIPCFLAALNLELYDRTTKAARF